MSHVAYQWATQTGAVLSAVAAVAVLTVSGRAWKRQRNPIDLAFAVAMAGCLVYLLASSASALSTAQPLTMFAAHAGYQVAIVSVSYFFLVSTSVTRFKIHAVWMTQGVLGLLLLTWYVLGFAAAELGLWALGGAEPSLWQRAVAVCVAKNLSSWTLPLLAGAWRQPAGSGHGLGGPARRQRPAPGPPCGALFLCRLPAAALTADHQPGRAPQPGGAVADERRRIAQDLHDGVGSQLVHAGCRCWSSMVMCLRTPDLLTS